MIIGLYALVPLLRTWLHHAEKKELDYFVVLFIVFQIGRATITTLIDKSLVEKIFDMVKIVELSWYLGYFVLGYILVRYGVSRKVKRFLYLMVPVGIVANYLISDAMSVRQGVYTAGIYDSFGIFTFLHSVALFVFVTDLFGRKRLGCSCDY
jgi:surface polysaccharide O-acyltransferase-like enzyme